MMQNNIKLIGLTGGIATGKSTVSKIIVEKGYPVIDADKISREVVEVNKPAYTEIAKNFGENIFETIKSNVERLSRHYHTMFLDIPLLFEQFDLWEKYSIKFDEIWLVYVGKTLQIERLMKRDGILEEEALRKIESQIPIDIKKARSSRIIDNSGDVEFLNKQIDKLVSELI